MFSSRGMFFHLSIILGLGSWMLLSNSSLAQARTHHSVIWQADYVDLSHPSWTHTHENTIGFGLWNLYMPNATNIKMKAHCQYDTNTWGYGPIENWRTELHGSLVVVYVPTRFVDTVILKWYAGAWVYAQDWAYYCDVTWDGP